MAHHGITILWHKTENIINWESVGPLQSHAMAIFKKYLSRQIKWTLPRKYSAQIAKMTANFRFPPLFYSELRTDANRLTNGRPEQLPVTLKQRGKNLRSNRGPTFARKAPERPSKEVGKEWRWGDRSLLRRFCGRVSCYTSTPNPFSDQSSRSWSYGNEGELRRRTMRSWRSLYIQKREDIHGAERVV